jgi:hypothetical protein
MIQMTKVQSEGKDVCGVVMSRNERVCALSWKPEPETALRLANCVTSGGTCETTNWISRA